MSGRLWVLPREASYAPSGGYTQICEMREIKQSRPSEGDRRNFPTQESNISATFCIFFSLSKMRRFCSTNFVGVWVPFEVNSLFFYQRFRGSRLDHATVTVLSSRVVLSSVSRHRAGVRATVPAVQVRGECSYGACKSSQQARLGLGPR
jgi:hypothetical protein